MIREATTVRLGDLLRIKHGFAFKGAHFVSSGSDLILTPGNFCADGGLQFRDGKEKFYSGNYPPDFLLRPGDLLVVMTDLTQQARILGAPAKITDGRRLLHNQRLGKVTSCSDQLDEGYLYHLFNSPNFRQHLIATATGSTVKHTAPERIYSFQFNLPPLPTQRRIADILTAYDDLIENNTRRIAILEDMARRLFEEWFNRPLSQGLPTGWAVAPLRNILKLHYGKALKADTRIEGAVPVYGSSGAVGSHNVALINGPGIILGRKGNVGSVFYSHCDFYPIDTVFYVETEVSLHFIYQTLRQQSFTNSDSAVPGLNRDLALSKEVAVPPSDLIERYDEWASPVMAQAELLRAANTNLRTTRDLLLPKLISGEIEVRAAEEELEAVPA